MVLSYSSFTLLLFATTAFTQHFFFFRRCYLNKIYKGESQFLIKRNILMSKENVQLDWWSLNMVYAVFLFFCIYVPFFFFGGQQAIRLNHYEWHIHALRFLHNEFIFQYAVGYGRSFGGDGDSVTGAHPSTVRIQASHDPRTRNWCRMRRCIHLKFMPYGRFNVLNVCVRVRGLFY